MSKASLDNFLNGWHFLRHKIKTRRAPSDGSNLLILPLLILPFALDYETWDSDILAGGGADDWSYDEETGQASNVLMR